MAEPSSASALRWTAKKRSPAGDTCSEDVLGHYRLDFLEKEKKALPPPLSEAPEKAVFLCENKLIALDTILPVAIELRAENPGLDIEFLFLRKDFMAEVRKNYVLWKGMERTGHITFLAHGGHARVSAGRKARSAWRLALKTVELVRRRSVLFYRRDFSSFPVFPLALAVRRGGGALVGYPGIAYPMSESLMRSLVEQEVGPVHYRLQADRHLLFHPLQEQDQRRHTSAPFVVIGSPRSFPRWRKHLEEVFAEEGLRDLEGRHIDAGGKRNVALFYPGNHDLPDLAGATSCRDQFVATLRAIREIAPGLRVLIKPHVICDLAELERDLAPFADLDIRLTFAHPHLLARVAEVCFMSNGSSVIDDMYATGVPVIETSLYKPDIAACGGSLFPNRGRIAAPTPELIEAAVRRVAEDPGSLPAPETGHLCWPKVGSISGCLWPTEGRDSNEGQP